MSCGLARGGRSCFSSKPKRSERRDGKFSRRRMCITILLFLIIGRYTSFSGGVVLAHWETRGVGRWMAPLSNTSLLSGGKSLISMKGLWFRNYFSFCYFVHQTFCHESCLQCNDYWQLCSIELLKTIIFTCLNSILTGWIPRHSKAYVEGSRYGQKKWHRVSILL